MVVVVGPPGWRNRPLGRTSFGVDPMPSSSSTTTLDCFITRRLGEEGWCGDGAVADEERPMYSISSSSLAKPPFLPWFSTVHKLNKYVFERRVSETVTVQKEIQDSFPPVRFLPWPIP